MLTPRGDAKALAEAMEYTILHHEETEEMAIVGQEVNELYSEDKISDRWNSFLDNVFVDKFKK